MRIFDRLGWLCTMAWRDMRAGRLRLLLFACAIAVGVASIVLIDSFAENLSGLINQQAKSLLGADLVFQNRRPFDQTFEEKIRHVQTKGRAEEIVFTSMALFPKANRTRMVQVRGLTGDFPFYGKMEVTPEDARERLQKGGAVAIAEENLLAQFGAGVGDRIRIGEQEFEVIGKLARVPGESGTFATFAPRVFVPRSMIEATRLLQPGSIARHKIYLQLAESEDPDAIAKKLKPELEALRIGVETVSKRKEDLGDSLSNVRRYLHLATVGALLLGGLGVAAAVQAHIRPRIRSAAVLRCLGTTRLEAFLIYAFQAVFIALVGTAIGLTIGVAAHNSLPGLLRKFLTTEVVTHVSMSAVASAALIGFGFAFLFALLPMLQTRRVPPLQAIRPPAATRQKMDPVAAAIVLLIFGGFLFLLGRGAEGWKSVAVLGGSVISAFLLLYLGAALTRMIARRAASFGPYYLRQGTANLFRPGNRTLLVMIVLGLGTQVILTMRMTEGILLKDALLGDPEREPNLIFFDIQPDQVSGAEKVMQERGCSIVQESPMVTMRLAKLKGRPVGEILQDKKSKIPAWTLQRDYRSSYRSNLSETEKIVAGEWTGSLPAGSSGVIPVSIEQTLAKDLGVQVGDELLFDVQGLEMPVRIGSIREVDWKKFQTNFFFVFPTGVLEEAPQFQVIVTSARTAEESAALQLAMVEKYPNISAFDLRIVIETIRAVVDKGRAAIQFMAAITILAGAIVLCGTTALGQEMREADAAIFRAIGASRQLIGRMHLAEDFVLGFSSALLGVILASATAWALAKWVFQSPFVYSWEASVVALICVSLITVVAGWVGSVLNTRRTPLDVLRNNRIG